MTKVDLLIKKFQELKEELNKGVNASYSPQPNAGAAPKPSALTGTSGGQGGMYKDGQDIVAMAEAIKFDKNGQWKLDKVDPDENVNIPHPKTKAKMANGVNKEDESPC